MIFRFWSIILTLYLLALGWATNPRADERDLLERTLSKVQNPDAQALTAKLLELSQNKWDIEAPSQAIALLALRIPEVDQNPEKISALTQSVSLLGEAIQQAELAKKIRNWRQSALEFRVKDDSHPWATRYRFFRSVIAAHPSSEIASLIDRIPAGEFLMVSEKTLQVLGSKTFSLQKIITWSWWTETREPNLIEELPKVVSANYRILENHVEFLRGTLEAALRTRDIEPTLLPPALNQKRLPPTEGIKSSSSLAPYRTSLEEDIHSRAYLAGYQLHIEEQIALALTSSGKNIPTLKKAVMVLRGLFTGKVMADEIIRFEDRFWRLTGFYTGLMITIADYTANAEMLIGPLAIAVFTWLRNRNAKAYLKKDAIHLNRRAVREATLHALASGNIPTDEQLTFLDALAEFEPDPELKALTAKAADNQNCHRELAPAPEVKPRLALKAAVE